MPLASVYPLQPPPALALIEGVDWETHVVRFGRLYTQARSLADRPIRLVKLQYEGLSESEYETLRTFQRLMKGPATRFDYIHHVDLIRDPGFEFGPITAVPSGLASFVPNSTFEDGDQGWKSDLGSMSIVNDGNARTGSWAAKKVIGQTVDAFRSVDYFPARPGEAFYIEGYIKSTVGADGFSQFRVSFHDADGTETGAPATTILNPTTTYTLRRAVVHAPPNSTWGKLNWLVDSHTVGTWYADDLFIRRYTEPWNLWPTSGLIGNGSTIQSTVKKSGSFALKIDPIAATDGEVVSTVAFPVFPGEELLISALIKGDAVGASGGIGVQHYNGNAVYVSGDISAGIGNTENAKEWVRALGVGSVPTLAAYALVRLVSDTGNTTGVDMYFDDLMVRRVIPCRFAQDELKFEYVAGENLWRGSVELVESP